MHLDVIIRHFDNPKPNGANSYMVRCPCHKDNQQSLSITEKDGKILMNCFAGCNSQDILWAVGLKETDLFNNDYHSQGDYENKVINLVDMFGKDFVIDQTNRDRIVFEELRPAIVGSPRQ